MKPVMRLTAAALEVLAPILGVAPVLLLLGTGHIEFAALAAGVVVILVLIGIDIRRWVEENSEDGSREGGKS